MGLLNSSNGWGRFTGNLCGWLLTWSFTSDRFMSDLFGPSHGWSTNVRVLLNTTFQYDNNCGFPILFFFKMADLESVSQLVLMFTVTVTIKFTVILRAPVTSCI